jgi:DHA2 family multidrug resistance protein
MVGPTLGPTLGGYLTDAYSWPWIFLINIPFGILALILTLTFVPDSAHAERVKRIDWQGLLLLALGIGTLQTMLERGERLDWFASSEIVLYAVVSVTSLVLFIWHELRTEDPVVDLRILKMRQFSLGVIFGGLMGVALFGSIFALPIYLQALQGFTAEQTGLVILPGALASAAVMAMMGRVAGKIDLRPVVLVGVLLFVASMWQHAHFTTASGKGDYFWPLILRGAGLGMIFVPLVTLTMSDLPLNRMAQGTGLFNLLRQLGGSVGIAIAATLLSRFEATHRAQLTEHITMYSEPVRERLAAIAGRLIASGTPPSLAQNKALQLLSLQVDRQVMMLSFEQLFLLFGVSLAAALPLLLFMKRPRGTQKVDVH